MSPPSRRESLQALATTLAVGVTAGCIADLGGSDSDEPETPATTPESPSVGPTLAVGEQFETDDGRAIRVSDPAVHPSVISVDFVSGTHYYERVADAGDDQWVAFVVRVEGFDLGPDGRDQYGEPIGIPLAVAVDGERYAEVIPVGRDGDADRDHVAIRVPIREATDAAVVWTRADGSQPRWRLPTSVVDRLAAAPEFEVRSWSVPDSVAYGEAFDGSVTVANEGTRDGRFLTTFGVKQGSLGVPEVSTTVPTGETRTLETTIHPHYFEGIETLRVILDWDLGRRTRKVDVVRSATPTPSG